MSNLDIDHMQKLLDIRDINGKLPGLVVNIEDS